MSMNETPSANRLHIGFFGKRNAGKSSLVNAITGQALSIVSDTPGTTTDPVNRAMELLPLGPVVIIDTPGIDDTGELGEQRVRRTRQVLNRVDIAVLVIDAAKGWSDEDRETLAAIRAKQIPRLVVLNKSECAGALSPQNDDEVAASALTGTGIRELKERIAALVPAVDSRRLVGDLITPGALVVLVIPIDEAAPKARLILPEQQAIRDILDAGARALVVRDRELKATLAALNEPPALVITDSQAFGEVAAMVPEEVPLTSFSILMARWKGFLECSLRGVAAIEKLQDGDRILIAEGCTHHRQCNDIGTVKIPAWLRRHTGRELQIETSSGKDFPEDLTPYALVIHCGGCMLTEREVRFRMKCAEDQGVPFTNYGITIAAMKGILKRATAPLHQ